MAVKNLCAKTRTKDNPYEVWESADGTWRWLVLKKWQVHDDAPYARWFCYVTSPFCDGEFGDCYVTDVTSNARCVQVEGARIDKPPVGGMLDIYLNPDPPPTEE